MRSLGWALTLYDQYPEKEKMNTEADAGERRYEEKWEKEEQLEAKERDLQQTWAP